MTARDVGLAVIERMSRRGLRFPSRLPPSEAVGDVIDLPSYGDPRYDDPVDLTAITRDIARGA